MIIFYYFVWILYICFWQPIESTTKCNGFKDLCDLRLDQVTFAGSHNAGSGFDGTLHYWSGGAVSSCFYRNHGLSFEKQLDFGVRYFDVDTCWDDRNNEAINCHCPGTEGKNCAYAGSIEKGLKEINFWLTKNPNDVIIIHFNHNSQKSYRKKIANSLKRILLKFWGPKSSASITKMNDDFNNFRRWPKLGEAILTKKRIFIFMASNLEQYLPPEPWLVSSSGMISDSWDTVAVSSSCSGITKNAKEKCNRTSDFMAMSAFAAYGLCTWDMAKLCSKWYGEAQEACYKKRNPYEKTVNFLLVDWLKYHKRYESVTNKAKFMNMKNIKNYLGRDVFLPEFQGCSYHSGKLYNYCWKICPRYGWCWTNVYCGKDKNLCKEKALECSGSCGYY